MLEVTFCFPFVGLSHLHTLNPPLVLKDFKTRNVLVDENFIAKVADAGLRNLLGRNDDAGPSSRTVSDDIFLDPGYAHPVGIIRTGSHFNID